MRNVLYIADSVTHSSEYKAMNRIDVLFMFEEGKKEMELRGKGRIGRNYSELGNKPLLVA